MCPRAEEEEEGGGSDRCASLTSDPKLTVPFCCLVEWCLVAVGLLSQEAQEVEEVD